MTRLRLAAACAVMLLLSACEREARRFDETAAQAAPAEAKSESALHAGGRPAATRRANPAEDNAYAVAQGKRLFTWFNCVGCHAHGGGGSGPALMDDKWLYGHAPANIYASIVEGRPNGMPSFGGKIPEAQVWQLVAYVRSMRGLVRSDVAPGRNDGMQATEPEGRREKATPTTGGLTQPR
jgi:cytochrome c oxidase cbb3-type subunit 3